MTEYTRFDSPIPDRYQLFQSRLFVAGTKYHEVNVEMFNEGSGQSLEFRPELDNKFDKNSIAIYGELTKSFLVFIKSTGQRLLGYVEKEVAKEIADCGLIGVIKPRLKYMKELDIEYDIMIPESKMKECRTKNIEKLTTSKNKKLTGYKAEIKEKFGFELPSSDVDKISLGELFEKEGDLEKACACYEGCLNNRFKGNHP